MDTMKKCLDKEIKRGFNRIKEFQSFCVESWDMTSIPSGKLRILSEYVFKAKSQAIQRMPEKRQIAHLVAFICEHKKKAMDEQLLACQNIMELFLYVQKIRSQLRD